MIKLELETPFTGKDIRTWYREVHKLTVESHPDTIHWGIYISHSELKDFETEFTAKGCPKVGKCKWLTAISRGRTQSGSTEVVDAFWQLSSEKERDEAERFLHTTLKKYNVRGSQGQKELYNLSKSDLIPMVDKLIRENYVIL